MATSASPTLSRFLAPRISCAISSSAPSRCRYRRPFWQRCLSSQSNNETAPFDRSIKLKQRTRSANAAKSYYDHHHHHHTQHNSPHPPTIPYDYFHREVAHRLVDRLDDILTPQNRGFPLALEIGCSGGETLYGVPFVMGRRWTMNWNWTRRTTTPEVVLWKIITGGGECVNWFNWIRVGRCYIEMSGTIVMVTMRRMLFVKRINWWPMKNDILGRFRMGRLIW
eukprot:CCRYP_016998-RC/>CCRYP_016998-RC protein AED:0.07 eAED:0.07 QI:345/1/1/1/0.5/0.66/3/845/223